MLIKEKKERRNIRFKDCNFGFKIRKKDKSSFDEHLCVIKREMEALFKKDSLAKDVKFLRKMAINIKQLDHDVRSIRHAEAKIVNRLLTTPYATLSAEKITLTQAAETFSEQHPVESDLSQILSQLQAASTHEAIFKRSIL